MALDRALPTVRTKRGILREDRPSRLIALSTMSPYHEQDSPRKT